MESIELEESRHGATDVCPTRECLQCRRCGKHDQRLRLGTHAPGNQSVGAELLRRREDTFSFIHVPTPEPEARNLVATGSADAAFSSYAQPGGYGKPVVSAPVAVTGFTISYAISGSNGQPVTTLKLTPLLLAKLLTESYRGTFSYGDPALSKNPLNITDDPEFEALNPAVAKNPTGSGPGIAESELMSLSSDSDVIEALTTYINDTSAARAFLNGTPDTSLPGEDMVVNPAYKGITLPVDQWPLLSTYVSKGPNGFDTSAAVSACLADSPEPLYSLIAAPLANLEDVSEAMQFEKPNSTMTCSSNAAETVNSMVSSGRQEAGDYFMLGITPLADDVRYNLQVANLQTTRRERSSLRATRLCRLRRHCSPPTQQQVPGRFPTATSKPLQVHRRTPARWSSTQRCRRLDSLLRQLRTTPPSWSSRQRQDRRPGRASGSSHRAISHSLHLTGSACWLPIPRQRRPMSPRRTVRFPR